MKTMRHHKHNRSAASLITVLCAAAGFLTAYAENTIIKDMLGDERTIYDSDGDGWDDLWCAIFSDIKHRNRNTDTDGDGVTDYDEMLLWRDPMVEGPIPQKPTAGEIAAAREQAEVRLVKAKEAWEQRKQEALENGMERISNIELGTKSNRMNLREGRMETLRTKADIARQNAAEERRRAEQLAAQHGYLLNDFNSRQRFAGMAGDYPVFVSGDNQVAAASVSVDELWPAAATPWASGSTGLD